MHVHGRRPKLFCHWPSLTCICERKRDFFLKNKKNCILIQRVNMKSIARLQKNNIALNDKIHAACSVDYKEFLVRQIFMQFALDFQIFFYFCYWRVVLMLICTFIFMSCESFQLISFAFIDLILHVWLSLRRREADFINSN